MKKTIFPILILLLTSSAAQADRIVLIYGDILEGKVVGETDTTITFRGDFGERTLLRSDIREIKKDGEPVSASVSPEPQAAPNNPARPTADSAPQTTPPAQVQPTPYDILKKNVEIQSQWKDLEIAYLQRSYIGGQTIQTRYIARIIPPDYLRANLTTPIPSTPQLPEGGEVEYDMYRAKSKLYQVVKMPNQPIQYLKLDLSRIDGISPGDNPVEAFKKGFAGAGNNEALLQAIARNSAIIGVENTDGHECWVIETVNTPDLVEAQVANQPAELRERLRQELSQLGRIRSWVGKEDLIQWRMENYSREGNLLLSMKMVTVKPNQNLSPEQLRMKVPKGTASAFVDVTDMVAGQFNQILNGSPGMVPIPTMEEIQKRKTGQPYQSTTPDQVWPGQSSVSPPPQPVSPTTPQAIPQTYTSAPQAIPQSPFSPPVQNMGMVPQTYSAPIPQAIPQQPIPQMARQQAIPQQQPIQQRPVAYQQPVGPVYYPQPQQPYAQPPVPQPGQSPYPQAFTQSYVVGGPQGMAVPQTSLPQGQILPQQQQRSSGIGGFFRRILGGGNSRQNAPFPMGVSPNGNQTMMLPVINGQPQFPSP